jgi:predicted double-glycine peptidase
MWDLMFGAAILMAGCGGLFARGWRLARRRSRRRVFWAGLAALLLTLAFAALVHGTLLVACLLPVSSAIVLGNWIPLGAGFLAGIVSGQPAIPRWRRAAIAPILLCAAWYSVLRDVAGDCPPSHHNWFLAGVAKQSSRTSCGPCSAVTLLKHYGIESSEREMIRLCLTDRKGTAPLGLYRGLKIKTANTGWDVEVVRCSTRKLCDGEPWPVLFRVRLEPGSHIPPMSGESWPSRMRQDHTVVVFGVTPDGHAEVGDPALATDGRILWPLERLEASRRGAGLRLVRR